MYSFSQAQRRGCSEILESLNYSNLLGLKDTIASKVNVWSKEDLINVILKHSQSAEELLKRRKVLREEILKYLIKHGVTVSTSSDKQQLIDKALVYWTMSEMYREPTAAKKDVQVLHQKQREELGQKLVENTESIVVKPQTMTSTTLRELRQVRQAEEQKEKEEEEKRQEEQLRRQEEMRTPPQGAMPMELNINVNILQYHSPPQQEASGVSGEQMGKEFCEWFFQLLNSQNPSFGQKAEEWGPQHFWDDAILHFTYCIQELVKEQHQSSVTVSLRLLSLVKDEQLLFNPNISQSGVKCVTSPHGIVAIAVAGTIHRNCQCLGVFEQLIGLIRTPVYGNNWKIRYINLKVKAFNDQPVILQPSVSVQMTELQACINELSAFLK